MAMEKLLYYIWNYRLFPLRPLQTTEGEVVEVLDSGILNRNAGPDFHHATIKIGDTLWVGSIEIHQKSSDWFQHGHHEDVHYNNVILHVVQTADKDVITEDGKCLPQLVLTIPEHLKENYKELCKTTDYPRCHKIIPQIDHFTIHSWLNALVYERLEQKAHVILERVKSLQGDWEKAYFITLARNFGFGINGDAFEFWAKNIPLPAVAHHRDNLFQIEAIFMGQAGLLDINTIPQKYQQEAVNDGYFSKLKGEYEYLAHKFSFTPINASVWKFLRLRPQNFPHVRLAQLSQLYYYQSAGFSQILEQPDIDGLQEVLKTHATAYWQSHYTFGCPSARNDKTLTITSRQLIIINTIVPLLYAYGISIGDEQMKERALNLLDSIRAENNYITRQWSELGIKVDRATDTQALIQLKKEYCDRKYCLHCRFGYEFMKRKEKP